ncbi:hypothetical protein F4776DRAFT_657902 [Hypoxylon sp. NC0597]|nr:hypothetical protein F4776DRAFT_657902 [Hypoxylon sp. NC0597]
MDADLRGIGHMTDSSSSERLKSTIPSIFRHQTQFQSDSDINFHNIGSSPDMATIPRTMLPEKGDTIMTYQDNLVATSSDKPYAMDYTPNTINKVLKGSSTADTFSLYDSLSGSDASSTEDDLDLEKSANEALSRWFGISLHRLVRPIRVIYAFEQVKQQCAGILQDEGHQLLDLHTEQDDDEIEDFQVDPYDAGEGGGSTRAGEIPIANDNLSSPNDKKRSYDSGFQAGSSPESYVKIRGRYKKHRVEGELSCPYRKRNPIRFNVRDYEKCANTSYQTMSQLKKHLTSIHFKNDSSTRTCTRCQQQFPPGHNMLAHYEQCPFPPQPRMNSPHADPEDGFNKEVESRLKSRGNGRVEEWPDLYKILFPGDETIPEPDFVPVVEDHEVFLKYERTNPGLSRDIHRLVAQQHHSPGAGRDLARDIMNLVQKNFDNILERPMAIPRYIQSQQNRLESELQGLQSSEDEFVDITEGITEMGNGSSGLQPPFDTFSTPRYMSPDGTQGDIQGTHQYSRSSEHTGSSLVCSTPGATAGMFGQPYPAERGNPPRFEPQHVHSYHIRSPNMFNNTTIAASESMMWPQRFQSRGQNSLSMETMSLPSDIHPPVVPNTEAFEDWWIPSNYQFPANVRDE